MDVLRANQGLASIIAGTLFAIVLLLIGGVDIRRRRRAGGHPRRGLRRLHVPGASPSTSPATRLRRTALNPVAAPGHRHPARSASVLLALLSIIGCAGSIRSGSGISVEAATAIAVRSTTSSVPVSVTATRASTYGLEARGTRVVPAETPVWVVDISGSFPVSCGPAPPPSVVKVCPQPLTTARVLTDSRTGEFIQAMLPVPAPS